MEANIQNIKRLQRLTAAVEVREVIQWLNHEYGKTVIPVKEIIDNVQESLQAFVDSAIIAQAVCDLSYEGIAVKVVK